jgi:phosphate transport system permease protein
MSYMAPSVSHDHEPEGIPTGNRAVVRRGDRIFSGLARGSGMLVVLVIALIAAFLLVQAVPAIVNDNSSFLFSRDWNVDDPDNLMFGVLGLLYTTVLISVFAMLLAVPVAIGIALFITNYAPARLSKPVGYVIDLLAAVPSIVYGLWGLYTLAPDLRGVASWLQDALGWIPFLEQTGITDGTVFVGGVVVAIMILPIITAISRDVFAQTPREHIEGALALGATRWEMIRTAVLPFGKPGLISASMLGLGRALGETVAITIILSTLPTGSAFSWSLFSGGETFASKIANNAAEFDSPEKTGAFIAAGLVLFVLTFAVNAVARAVINRHKEYSS